MRCPDCNKFVSYDTDAEPEVDNEGEVSDLTVTATIRRVLPCAECGTELKEYTFELEHELGEADLPGDDAKCTHADAVDGAHEFEVEGCEASNTERLETKDRKGRQIRSSRYMTTYYGVEAEVEVKCTLCEHTVTFQMSDEASASSFEEVV